MADIARAECRGWPAPAGAAPMACTTDEGIRQVCQAGVGRAAQQTRLGPLQRLLGRAGAVALPARAALRPGRPAACWPPAPGSGSRGAISDRVLAPVVLLAAVLTRRSRRRPDKRWSAARTARSPGPRLAGARRLAVRRGAGPDRRAGIAAGRPRQSGPVTVMAVLASAWARIPRHAAAPRRPGIRHLRHAAASCECRAGSSRLGEYRTRGRRKDRRRHQQGLAHVQCSWLHKQIRIALAGRVAERSLRVVPAWPASSRRRIRRAAQGAQVAPRPGAVLRDGRRRRQAAQPAAGRERAARGMAGQEPGRIGVAGAGRVHHRARARPAPRPARPRAGPRCRPRCGSAPPAPRPGRARAAAASKSFSS